MWPPALVYQRLRIDCHENAEHSRYAPGGRAGTGQARPLRRMSRRIHGVDVVGVDVDAETRCAHYAGPADVIAIKFKCCDTWYPCIDCHRALASHEVVVWPIRERDERAVLCGVCGATLSILDYLACGSTCPQCGAQFNPGCVTHRHLYFEVGADASRNVVR